MLVPRRVGFTTTDQAPEQWQKALTSALSVAALSVIDGTAIFHATWNARATNEPRCFSCSCSPFLQKKKLPTFPKQIEDVGILHKIGHETNLKCTMMICYISICSDTVNGQHLTPVGMVDVI